MLPLPPETIEVGVVEEEDWVSGRSGLVRELDLHEPCQQRCSFRGIAEGRVRTDEEDHKTYRSAHSQVHRRVRILPVAIERATDVRLLGITGIGVRGIRPVPVVPRRLEAPTKTVLGIVIDAPVLGQPQRRVGKRPVRDTRGAVDAAARRALAVGTEAELVGTPDGRRGQAAIVGGILGPVPVRLSARVVAFVLEEPLVQCHEGAVPRQKTSDTVDDIGLCDVNPLQFIPSCHGALDARLGG